MAPAPRPLLALALALVLASAPCPGAEAAFLLPHPKLFVFGDSLADVGNLGLAAPSLPPSRKAMVPPYGKNFRPPGPTGRFCDGKLYVDFLANAIGISSPPPALLPTANFASGANFAVARAGALNATNVGTTLSLGQQVDSFARFVAAGKVSPQDLSSRSVVGLVIGSNDYIVYIQTNTPAQIAATLQQFAQSVTGAMVSYMGFLANLGVKNFVVVNLAPLGCTPSILASTNTTSGCNALVNQIAQVHNQILKITINLFRGQCPGCNVLLQDIYAGVLSLGFPQGQGACCGWPAPLNGLVLCGNNATVDGVTYPTYQCL